jgi:plastocyanin
VRKSRLLLGLLVVAFAACGDDTFLGTGNTVNANGVTFDPDSLTVSGADKTVTWGIFGGGPHTITFQDAVTSGNRNSGAYLRDFATDTVGTYRYRCENHSTDFVTGMVGVIVVQ